MKRTISFILAIVFVSLLQMAASAAEGPDVPIGGSEVLTWGQLDDGSLIITGLKDPFYEGILTIPDYIDDVPVLGIDSGAFTGTNITALHILEGVSEIGTGAFEDCTDLVSVYLPESCVSLTSEDNAIGANVFAGCTSLENVFLPANWEHIPEAMFDGCTSLVSIDLPNIRSVGARAFLDCPLREVQFGPDPGSGRLEIIADGAFEGIGAGIVELTEPLRIIGANAYRNCRSLQVLLLPGSLEEIGEYAFADSTMEFASLADGIEQVPATAFSGCANLAYVQLPDSITDIAAFTTLPGLRTIFFDGTPEQWAALDTASLSPDIRVVFGAIYLEQNPQFGSMCAIMGLEAEAVPLTAIDLIAQIIFQSQIVLTIENADGQPLIHEADPVGTGCMASWRGYDDDEEPTYGVLVLKGDVNGSGRLSIAQVVRMAQALSGTAELTLPQSFAADLDSSGELNITDVVLEARRLAGA